MEKQNTPNRDAVVYYPNSFNKYSIKKFEPGYISVGVIDGEEHYFIHARATLPLKDVNNGIGFGLWIEVSKEDFDKYIEGENDDEKYLKFEAKGKLANNWPGFENTLGLKVKLRTINTLEKVYVWDVEVDNTADPLFRIALQMQKGQDELKERVRGLVEAWMKDFGENVSNYKD